VHRGAPFVTQFPIKTIIHPTDFSGASAKAFAHAMAFSLAAQSRLYILHVAKDGENRDLYSQPHVRELLALWGKMSPQEQPEAIAARTGVQSPRSRCVQAGSANALINSLPRISAI